MPGEAPTSPTPAPQALAAVWEAHLAGEFAARSVAETLATMTEDAHVNHVPVLTGGVGRAACGDFYGRHFIPQIPPDFETVPVSRTIGAERVVDEVVLRCTHTVRMDWLLPGVEPTGKRVEVPVVLVVHIRDGKVASEHIYWDQASVLVQVGLLDAAALPVAGAEQARKALDPAAVPSNALIARGEAAGPAAGG
jgi:carboxymethylenebutenolidase